MWNKKFSEICFDSSRPDSSCFSIPIADSTCSQRPLAVLNERCGSNKNRIYDNWLRAGLNKWFRCCSRGVFACGLFKQLLYNTLILRGSAKQRECVQRLTKRNPVSLMALSVLTALGRIACRWRYAVSRLTALLHCHCFSYSKKKRTNDWQLLEGYYEIRKQSSCCTIPFTPVLNNKRERDGIGHTCAS